jgi:hypothetical protein
VVTGIWYDKAAPRIIHADGTTNNFSEVRAALVPADSLQVNLGRPNREQVVTARSSVATTLQALELTNGAELAALVRRGSQHILAEGKPGSSVELIDRLYGTALGRKPNTAEAKLAKELIGEPAQQSGLEDMMWALTMLPEFQLIY